jgi:hypothetical protein
MHQLKLLRMFSNAHTMLLLMAFLAKPMFKVNKPLFLDVTWQNILGLVVKYFVTSLHNIQVAKEYINDIP